MKIQWHILFWSLYLLIESFMVYNTGEWQHKALWHSILYHGSLLIPRLLITYIFLFYVLPFITKGKQALLVKIILSLIYFAVSLYIYRLFLNKVSWPWIMGHWPNFNPFDLRLSSYSFLRMITPLSLLIGVHSFYKMYFLRLKNERLQKEQLRSELNYLKAQINPHFLFNSFNNLYVLALDKSDKTAPAIEKLSSLFRYILHSSSRESVSIGEEIKMMENYIEMERMRYDKIDIDLRVEINDANTKIPPLLMLPFIENAFKHGASEILDNPLLKIEIVQSESGIDLTCMNKVSEAKSDHKSNSGEGIKNVLKRLNLLFSDRYTLQMGQTERTYKVKLFIPT